MSMRFLLSVRPTPKGVVREARANRTKPEWNFDAGCLSASIERLSRQHSKGPAMSDTPPDRLANNPNSPYFVAALPQRGIGIRFQGVEKTNVKEYFVSEDWVRVAAGTSRDRAGIPMTITLQGSMEPSFKDEPEHKKRQT